MRLESLYLGFRTRNGLDLRRFKDRFGQDLMRDPPGILPFLVEQGKIEVKTDRATPTLEGMAVADALPLLF
jgi:oxygen-independent coproporphyrinogen-3 oxidase